MAQTGREDRPADGPVPGDAAPQLTGQRARQGQYIKGMLAVLVLGILLLVIAYAVMLALQAQPASVINEPRAEAAQETQGLAPGESSTSEPQTPSQ